MSKLLANQIANYNDNGPVEVKEGVNVPSGKPFQVGGAAGTSGDYLKSTGSSVAWTTFPTIPAAQVNSDWNATSGLAQISNKPILATVATSGQYSDLSGLPSIPAAQIQSDWNISNTASVDFIKNKPTLFSGAYNDLTGKPTIPSNLADLADVSSNAPSNNEVLKWNGSNWAPATDASGGGGVTTFTALTDTPGNFTSQAGKYLKVNAGATALEYVTLPVDPDTNTTYSQSSVADGSNVKLRLTDSGSTDDDILITAGNNIAISSVTAGGFTIASTASGGATVTTDDSAPGSPTDGDLWWKSDEGRLKVYYADGSSNQWVDASPPVSLDLTAFTGHILPNTDDLQDIGSASKKIRDLYLGSTSLHLGTVDISESSGKLVLPAVEMTGHFIPDTNAAYDLGSAEYKIRHLFLSGNSFWIGDDHKIDIGDEGKMKFRKRNKSKVPASITDAGGDEAGALAHSGKASLELISCFEWLDYLTSLDPSKTDLTDLFPPEESSGYTDEDYEEIINQEGPGTHPAPIASGVAVLPIPLFTGNTFVLDQPVGDISLDVVGAKPTPGNNIDFKVYVMQGATARTISAATIDGVPVTSIRVLGATISNVLQVFEFKCLHHNGGWNAIITAE